jgi:hypothetical protein
MARMNKSNLALNVKKTRPTSPFSFLGDPQPSFFPRKTFGFSGPRNALRFSGSGKERRVGMINTLEAVFSVVILLSFVLFALPRLQDAGSQNAAIRNSFGTGLESLDKRDVLRPYAYANPPNLSQIKLDLQDLVSKRTNFTIGVAQTNITTGIVNFSESVPGGYRGNITYTTDNSTRDGVFVTISFSNSDDAEFYINNGLLELRDTEENSSKLDLTDQSVNGTSVFSVVSESTGSANYTLNIETLQRLDELPTDESVSVITYFLSGNSSISPREVRAFFWRSR